MKEGLRGRRRWFAVESKSFELLIDDVGGKLIGCILGEMQRTNFVDQIWGCKS